MRLGRISCKELFKGFPVKKKKISNFKVTKKLGTVKGGKLEAIEAITNIYHIVKAYITQSTVNTSLHISTQAHQKDLQIRCKYECTQTNKMVLHNPVITPAHRGINACVAHLTSSAACTEHGRAQVTQYSLLHSQSSSQEDQETLSACCWLGCWKCLFLISGFTSVPLVPQMQLLHTYRSGFTKP